jgi:hypothetical protein
MFMHLHSWSDVLTCCSSPCGLQRPSGGCSQSRISTHVKLRRPLNSAST